MFEFEPIRALDYLLAPFVATIIYVFAKRYRDRHYPNGHPYRNFFLPALSFKMIAAVIICRVYVYSYENGDTITFYYHARIINSSLNESYIKWFNLLLAIPDSLDPNYFEYIQMMKYYGHPSTYLVAQFTSVLSLITFNTFVPAALLFAALTFTGFWALFVTFASLYPKLLKPIATSTLFIPSVALWASGIFKDTLCMFGIGWLCYSTFQFFINSNWRIKNILLFVGSFLLIAIIKVYIIICFFPPLAGWILLSSTRRIRNRLLATFINIFSVLVLAIAFSIVFSEYSNLFGEFSVDRFQQTSQTTRNYIAYVSSVENGSAYDLGNFEPTLSGMFSKFPQAVNVTLFRPYLWEAKKVIVFLNALESFIILMITIKLVLVIGFKKIFYSIASENKILFTFFFSIIFAFFVGVSSYNFGALSRYKIPCIPFYLLTMVFIYYQHAKPGKRLLRFLWL